MAADTSISTIISNLTTTPPHPLSKSTLLHLQTLALTPTNPDSDSGSDSELTGTVNTLWDVLTTNNIAISSLINPITATMDDVTMSTSLLAADVYLSLILSCNAPVFSLFTPMAFLSLLRSIRSSFKPRGEGCSSPGDGSWQNCGNPRKRGGTAKRGRVSNLDDGDSGGEGCSLSGGGSGRNGKNPRKPAGRGKRGRVSNSDDEDGGERDESGFDVKMVFNVLDKLVHVLGLVHLGRFPDSMKSLVQTIAEVPVLGVDLCGSSWNYKKLCDFCSFVLRQVLRPEHGDQEVTGAEVLKAVSGLILSMKPAVRTFGLLFVRNEFVGVAENSDSVRKALVNLPRYLTHKVPEKADARGLAVDSIVEVVKVVDFDDQIGFIEYVMKMAQGKSHLRFLAVDLIPKVMVLVKDQLRSKSVVEEDGSWKVRCLAALILRCSDSVAGVRARALSNLAQLVGVLAVDEEGCMLLKDALGFNDGRESGANSLLRKRCTDEKAAVRKAVLLLITKLMGPLGGSLDPNILKTMGLACSDPLVSIRKAAISALSEALRTFADTNVITEWLHSVPRLITDSETSIQEECENLFMELVLDRVSRTGSSLPRDISPIKSSESSSSNFQEQLTAMYLEGILDLLREMCDGEVTPWIRKICTNLGKKKRLKPKIAFALQNIIRTSESLWSSHAMPIEKWTAPRGAWLLLSEVSVFLPKAVDWEFLHHHWKLLDKHGHGNKLKSKSPIVEDTINAVGEGIESNSVAWAGDRVLLLQTISSVSVELPPEPAAELAHHLLKRLEGFDMHPTEVNAHMKALKTLCRRKAINPQEADIVVMEWADQLLYKASNIIDMFLSKEQEANKENTLFTPPRSGTKKGKKLAASSRLLSQATVAVHTIGSLVIICPSIDLKGVIPVLHSMITSGTNEPRSDKLPGSTISIKQNAPSLYIQAWVTMGKICLADAKLAKRYIPLFVQELEKSDCAALRNNIIVVIADFCVRYTALVDCYIAKITKCLRDSCELVRRQTFILLSRLLQTDYVKWRGVLFLRFLLSLVDESEKIRQLADFLFGNILKAKAPLLAYNSFVEAVFVLNDCHAHLGNKKSQNSKVDNKLFSIRGNDEKSRSRRMHIYVALLKQMAPEHLLATFAKICAEILAAASDGVLSIDDLVGQSVIQDAFEILACKEMRLPSNRISSSETGDMDEEAGDNGTASTAAARSRAITQAVKKGLIQNTIPIFIELKRLLETRNSPLIGSLMECLRVLLKEYKNEIEDILVADKQLQKELIYDLHKYEAVKAKSKAEENIAIMQRTDRYCTPNATHERSTMSKKSDNDSKVASAMADAVAEAVARSVLKSVNRRVSTPPLSALKMPKLKSSQSGGLSKGDKPPEIIESLRRRQTFDSDEDS